MASTTRLPTLALTVLAGSTNVKLSSCLNGLIGAGWGSVRGAGAFELGGQRR